MARRETAPTAGDAAPLLSRIVTRSAWIDAACLLLCAALAWWWLWHGATGMDEMAGIPGMPDMPGMAGMETVAPPMAPWSVGYLGPAILMWIVMMVAMMLPSAAPMILLHAAFTRRAGRAARAATAAFAAAYLLLWALFATIAAIGQAALVDAGLLTEMSLALGSRMPAALLLMLAGLYQLSPFKQRCLAQCRSPVGFLMRHWRSGIAGATRMGLIHGLFCLGCCWMLMLLLFVGGVMTLAWVGLLTLVVLAEKYAPRLLHARLAIGGLLFCAGVALLFGVM